MLLRVPFLLLFIIIVVITVIISGFDHLLIISLKHEM